MELTLSLDKRMVCGKCGRELNKDAVIYYSDKSCDVYCCQCGEGKYTHIAGRRVIKYVRTSDGFHPALTPVWQNRRKTYLPVKRIVRNRFQQIPRRNNNRMHRLQGAYIVFCQ